MDAGVAIRVLRAAVFSALLLALSVGSHILLTGAPLPGTMVLASGLIVFGAGLLLAVTERSFAQIAVVLVPLELVLNAVFNVSQQTCADAGRAAGGGLLPQLLCGGSTIRGLPFGPALDAPGSVVHLTTPLLLAVLCAHLAVSLLAAGWLRMGEKAVFDALGALAAWLAAPLRLVLAWFTPSPADHPPFGPIPDGPDRPGPQDVLLRGARRRGPPAAALLAG